MPGPQSAHSPEEWQRARDMVAAGISLRETAERLGISYDNLRFRSSKEDWFVPSTALHEAKAVIAKAHEAQQVNSDKPDQNSRELSQSLTTGVQVAESIAEMGQKGQIHALRGMLPRFLKTFDQDSELLTKPVEDWKTAGSMVNIFSKLAGLDKPQTLIQTNVWGGEWGQTGAVPVDGEVLDGEE